MLNTLPHSISPVLPARPFLRRKRGGQPSNRNTLRHGHYAVKHLPPLANIPTSKAIHPQISGNTDEVITLAIMEHRLEIERVFQYFIKTENARSAVAGLNLITRSVSLVSRLGKELFSQQKPQRDLLHVSLHVHDLIRYDFHDQGVTRDVDLFRENRSFDDFNSLSSWGLRRVSPRDSRSPVMDRKTHSFLENRVQGDFNSPPSRELQRSSWHASRSPVPAPVKDREAHSFLENRVQSDFNSHLTLKLPMSSQHFSCSAGSPRLFLTPLQWALLEPLLPRPQQTGRRGRPRTDPRKLLDAIFWKFGHYARWQDLPKYYPPMLTRRRYYRRLFLSGRLATLYAALYKDLRESGRADLTAYVNRGDLLISGRQLILSPALDETWQLRTALLFLQIGVQVLHCHQRRNARIGYFL